MKFTKTIKNTFVKGIILIFLIIMLLFPSACFQGASTGLLLWFHNILPNLLPFIIISNLIVRLNITKQISKFLYPCIGKLFRVSMEGCYPIAMGFLSGIPLGAKATADLVTDQKISIWEGQFLLGMCNNASPMFIIGYIAISQLKLPHIKYALFVIIYGSAILSSIMYRILFMSKSKKQISHNKQLIQKVSICNTKVEVSEGFSFPLFDSSILNGFEIVTKIGGYIILFSILAQIIKTIGPSDSLIKAVLMGVLEMTTGVNQLCISGIDQATKIVLVTTITSFGGLSGIAQTKSVLGGTRLSIGSYCIMKLMNAGITLFITLLYIELFHIM